MPRGNGQHAKQAMQQKTGLAKFVKHVQEDKNSPSPEYVDWAEVNPNYVIGAVCSAVRQGGALLLGCSRDKRSYSLKVYADGQGEAFYFPCNPSGIEGLEAMLLAIIESAEWAE